MNEYKIKEQELKWLAIDLDKTIAVSNYPNFKLQEPIKGAKESIDKLVAKGWKIIIHTARPWSDYDIIEKWLNKYEIPHRRIVCGKLFAKYYIDDRGIEFKGNWNKVLKKIK